MYLRSVFFGFELLDFVIRRYEVCVSHSMSLEKLVGRIVKVRRISYKKFAEVKCIVQILICVDQQQQFSSKSPRILLCLDKFIIHVFVFIE